MQVEAADVSVFGAIFVLLDVVDGALARRSKSGPTRVGAALDVESDSLAVLFLSLAATRKVSRWGEYRWENRRRFVCVAAPSNTLQVFACTFRALREPKDLGERLYVQSTCLSG